MPGRHLDGKVAVVTGGAGGIGSWICKIFAEQGASVVVADTGADVEGRMGADPAKVDAVVTEITEAGGEATGVVGDITVMDVAEDVIRTALDTYGGLDILVCAHGILRERMIFNMLEEDWDQVLDVHLKGCFSMTKFASMYWRSNRDRGGRILYFTSAAGINGAAGQPNYSAAHAAKIGLSLSNAQALSRYGVTSNCISPTAATRMTDRARDDVDGQSDSEAAVGGPRDPKNAVPAIVYLASDEAADITGRVVGVSGHRITMYREPTSDRSIYSRTPLWDIDTLFQEMEQMLSTAGELGTPGG